MGIGIFAWIVLSIHIGAWAINKGRNGAGFFFLSLLMSPLIGFVVLVAIKNISKPSAQTNRSWKCSKCAATNGHDIFTCFACQYTLE